MHSPVSTFNRMPSPLSIVPSSAASTSTAALPVSKCKKGLFLLLVAAAALQAWVSLLHHSRAVDNESIKEEASLSPPFVEWGRNTDSGANTTNKASGIDIMDILNYLNASAGIPGPYYEPNQPDDLYIIRKGEKRDDPSTIIPTYGLSMNTYWKHPVAFRRRYLTDGLNFIDSSLQIVLAENLTAWPRIERAIADDNSFPLLINWDGSENCTAGGSESCCDSGLDPSGTIPLTDAVPVLRFMSPLDCQYRLLSPTGHVLQLAGTTVKDGGWPAKFAKNEEQHPYHQKVPRLVYRGPHDDVSSKLNALSPSIADVLEFKEEEEYDWDNFQKYVAVLDVDTKHYPQLLCQNSVVFKTKASCTDMFVGTLKAWEHYIPVEADMSDIVERFQFIAENEEKAKAIIQNANAWCAQHLDYSYLQHHFLTTISEYLKLLDAGPSKGDSWQRTWKERQEEWLSGHFFLTRPTAYSLPKPVVGAIKTGLRRDDPHYNATSGNVERQLMDQIMSKWGKEKQQEEYKKQMLREKEQEQRGGK